MKQMLFSNKEKKNSAGSFLRSLISIQIFLLFILNAKGKRKYNDHIS